MPVKLIKLLLALTIAALTFSTCGKRRPPQPPIERVPQRVDIAGRQVGDRIDVIWRMPARNAGVGSTLKINRIDVYRLSENLSDPLSLTEQEFASRSTLIGSIPVTESDFGLKEKIYSDKLQILGQAARLRYAIRFINSSGQRAAYSNFFLIEPSANISNSPSNFAGTVSQESINLRWTAPAANLDGSKPANIVGYNVYREEAGGGFTKLNEKPENTPGFSDQDFVFGKKYRYFVRTVSLGANATEVESFSSETIGIEPVDTFKPTPPEALTIAAAPSTISIFFAFNLEKDVAGYRVYRSTDSQAPKSEWKELTANLIDSNTFQDNDVASNVVYYYYVVAVDTTGNISDPSEVVSETAL